MFMKDPKNDEIFNKRFSSNDITGNTCATIGLKFIKNYQDNNSKNFISILHDLDIIDDYITFIEYDTKGNEKLLLIGEYPEKVFKNKYIQGYSVNIKIYNRFKTQWGFKCDKILSGNELFQNTDVTFHHNLGVIYAPYEYKEFIEKNFFMNYIDSKMCTKKDNGEQIYFYCDKAIEKEINKFPEIKFIKNEFESEFILTYKDLFFTKGNNTYFLILFHNLYKDIWELGKPFLKKFLFAYNFNSKIIIHYNLSNEIKEIKNEKREIKVFSKYIILFAIIIGIFSFLLGKKIYKKRKNKITAKELEKNFSYKYNEKRSKLIDE